MTDRSRPLSYFESGLHLATEKLHSSTICCWTSGTGVVTLEQVREALSLLHDRHPFLRGRISGTVGSYRFEFDVSFGSIPFHVVQCDEESEITSLIEHLMNTATPGEHHLWEARFIHPQAGEDAPIDRWKLLLLLHHSISDGRSALVLLDELGTILGSIVQGEQPDRTSRPVPAPIEQQVDPPGTVERWMKMCEDWGDQIGDVTPWPTDGDADFEDRHCHLTFTDHDPDFIARLVDLCHRKGTTIQGAFASAVARGIADFRDRTINIDTLTPADLRSFSHCEIPVGELACKISCLATGSLDVSSSSDPWEVARNYTDELHRQLETMVYPPLEFSADDVRGFVDSFVNPAHEFVHGFCVSNIGLLHADGDHGRIQFEDVDVTASIRYGGFPILQSIYGYRGHIRCSYVWTEPLMSRRHALELTESVELHLRNMVEAG